MIIKEKSCTRCKRVKLLDQFDRKKENKTDGHKSWCKVCAKKHNQTVWKAGKGDKDKKRISASPREFLTHWIRNVKKPNSRFRKPMDKNLTVEDLLEIYEKQQGKCAKTGIVMTHLKGAGKVNTNISVDRIDNNIKEYRKDNIQLVCFRYNLIKHDMNEKELEFWCKTILSSMND